MPITRVGSDEDVSFKKRNSVTSEIAASCFDCNICLDSAHDPVVTLCGHLYCWPCIYKWIQIESSTPGSEEKPKCPVCKAHISNSSLVPLYGRGTSSQESESKKSQVNMDIPHRPQAIGTIAPHNSLSPTFHVNQQFHQSSVNPPQRSFQHYRPYLPQAFGSYAAMAPSSFGGTAVTSLFSPVAGVFGEIFSARMFGSSGARLIAYPHPSPYLIRGSGSPRVRRQEMQVDKFLNRLSIFLFCCFILCLLLF
ncbi:PREDICTED: E3 ubiquitin-protein ligase RMA1H1-like [Nicotiana attenuata]|uniref:E3 ubiquitin-protein ligase RMA n=1 Tax=Nicotiana attenuata TaxID=49451 RepID=A0A1J6J393_NICAT|nr:PREDICTED: E3 ubiquitin-protein ligase RMA1H1-like [Nicotiana attenuata]OIT01777.1 e3 ubiquitin-protein ligase rma1h1 [Nicotiana attenuata]